MSSQEPQDVHEPMQVQMLPSSSESETGMAKRALNVKAGAAASLLALFVVGAYSKSSSYEAPLLLSKSSTSISSTSSTICTGSSLRARSESSETRQRNLIEDDSVVSNATNHTTNDNATDLVGLALNTTTLEINATDKALIAFNFTSLNAVTVHQDSWGGSSTSDGQDATDAPTEDATEDGTATGTATGVPTDTATAITTETVVPTDTTTSSTVMPTVFASTGVPTDGATTDAPTTTSTTFTTTESPLVVELDQLAEIDQVVLEFNNTEIVTDEDTDVFQDNDSNNETQILDEVVQVEDVAIVAEDDDLQDTTSNLEDDDLQVDTPTLPEEDDDAWLQPDNINTTMALNATTAFNGTFSPTPAPTPMEPFGPITYVGNDGGFFAPYPLGVCQGDCDTDADCADGLYCHERFGPFDDRTPGCTGGDTLGLSFDVCAYNWTSGIPRSEIDPEPTVEYFDKMQYVGNDGTWYSTFPLGICQGDCDEDADCGEGLLCYQRGSRGFIPGCTGGEDEVSTADFCVWDSSFLDKKEEFMNPPPMPNGSFRLKLYWEEGYLWQNETFEREWCMFSDYKGYPGTGNCWYAREILECSPDEVYMGLCIDNDPRQWWTFVDLGSEYSNNNGEPEVLIQTAGDGPPRCLVRESSDIFLDAVCDPENEKQRFFALRGDLDGDRFELGQRRGFTRSSCMTNAHHPKSGEVVEFHDCESARGEEDQTSYWEKF